jgi:hypothetical protein
MIPEYLKLSTIAQVIKKEAKQKKLIPDFAKKIAFQRWASAIFLRTILSFLLTPQLHFSYPEYKVGFIAIREMYGPTAIFAMPDPSFRARRRD